MACQGKEEAGQGGAGLALAKVGAPPPTTPPHSGVGAEDTEYTGHTRPKKVSAFETDWREETEAEERVRLNWRAEAEAEERVRLSFVTNWRAEAERGSRKLMDIREERDECYRLVDMLRERLGKVRGEL